jgi:hypothetical protein
MVVLYFNTTRRSSPLRCQIVALEIRRTCNAGNVSVSNCPIWSGNNWAIANRRSTGPVHTGFRTIVLTRPGSPTNLGHGGRAPDSHSSAFAGVLVPVPQLTSPVCKTGTFHTCTPNWVPGLDFEPGFPNLPENPGIRFSVCIGPSKVVP